MKSNKSKLKPTSREKPSELEKAIRRLSTDALARSKKADSYALCGNNYYSVSPFERSQGKYWSTCARCGKPLKYYSTYEEANQNRRECSRSK
jgi:hypothetical protein